MLRFVLICIVICVVCSEQTLKAAPTSSTMYSEIRIAFGSNFYPNASVETQVFSKILERKPDVFLWIGETLAERSRGKNWGQQLIKLKERSDYSELSEKVEISGIEDLMYASSDVREKYLSFLDEDPSSDRWSRLELFQSFWIESNPTSSHESVSAKRVKILMLDVNMIDFESEEISPNQFAWLEKQLIEKEDDHFLTIITSGYQILPHDKIYELFLEMKAKMRFLELIKKSPVPVLLMSGASMYSFGEVMKFPCSVEEDLGYNLYEITSAGMNWNDFETVEVYNKFTVGPTFSKLQDRVYEPNFGYVKIVYNHMTQSPEVTLEIISEEGDELISTQADFKKVKERKKDSPEVSTDLSVCSKKVYSNYSVLKSAITNLPLLLKDPKMRIYILAGLSFLLCLFVSILFFGLRLMTQAKGMGGSSSYSWGNSMRVGLDEYERYHMD